MCTTWACLVWIALLDKECGKLVHRHDYCIVLLCCGSRITDACFLGNLLVNVLDNGPKASCPVSPEKVTNVYLVCTYYMLASSNEGSCRSPLEGGTRTHSKGSLSW